MRRRACGSRWFDDCASGKGLGTSGLAARAGEGSDSIAACALILY